MSSDPKDNLIKHSALLFAAQQASNACNLLFQVVMGRSLAPEQYGVLALMLSFLLVLSTPMDALRTAAAHYAGRYRVEGRIGQARRLVLRMCAWLAGGSLLLSAAGVLAAPAIASFFHVSGTAEIRLTSLMVGGMLLLPLLSGALQGVQAFLWLAAGMFAFGLARLAAGFVLVHTWAPIALAGVVAQTLGVAAAVLLGFWALHLCLPRQPAGEPARDRVLAFFLRSLVMLGAFAVLMNADVILGKHYFAPEAAGRFARAGTICRAIIFLPMPIAFAMFPKVITTGHLSESTRRTLYKAVAMSAGLILATVAAVSWLPQIPLGILFKDPHPTAEMARLVRSMVWAMAPLGLTYLLLSFELAQHRFRSLPALALCAAGYIAGVALWHATPFQVVGVLAVMNILSAAVLVVYILVVPSAAPAAPGPQA